jgi:hypothetical protein
MAKGFESTPSLDLNSPDLEKQVADALEHLWEFSYLGKSTLAKLDTVKRSLPQKRNWSHVDLGSALSGILQAAIEDLKVMEEYLGFSREALYHPILYQAFIKGAENKFIAQTLGISLRTYYRRRTEAIQVVAQILRDWETRRSS